jgi:hypothetical protein
MPDKEDYTGDTYGWSIAEIKRADRDAGQYVFSRDTMRFLNSGVSREAHMGTDSPIDKETSQPRMAILGLDASGELVQREVTSYEDIIRMAEEDWPVDGSIIDILGVEDESATEVAL